MKNVYLIKSTSGGSTIVCAPETIARVRRDLQCQACQISEDLGPSESPAGSYDEVLIVCLRQWYGIYGAPVLRAANSHSAESLAWGARSESNKIAHHARTRKWTHEVVARVKAVTEIDSFVAV